LLTSEATAVRTGGESQASMAYATLAAMATKRGFPHIPGWAQDKQRAVDARSSRSMRKIPRQNGLKRLLMQTKLGASRSI
jgi:rubrerythrin